MKEEKNILEQTRDQLLTIREFCMNEIKTKINILEDKKGELSNLISVAEQMMMMQKIKDLQEAPEKQKDKLNELKKKFKMRNN